MQKSNLKYSNISKHFIYLTLYIQMKIKKIIYFI